MVHDALSLLFGASDQVGDACDEGTQGRQEQIAYHEAGHVVVGEVLDPGCTTLATVLKCNNKDGGFTLGKRSELLDYPNALEINIIVGLGGKAAVEQRLGLMDIGALDDTKKVADKIERLVCEAACYGASLRRIRYLSSSEALDNNVEQVIAAEFERYYLKAKEVLAKNMGLLEAVATCLLEKKIITLHDIEKLKCEHPIVPVLR